MQGNGCTAGETGQKWNGVKIRKLLQPDCGQIGPGLWSDLWHICHHTIVGDGEGSELNRNPEKFMGGVGVSSQASGVSSLQLKK